jgi:glucans biosynthesis protein
MNDAVSNIESDGMSNGANGPMREGATGAPRCGARTRAGRPCRNRPVTGRSRCRMHGGAEGSGAPRGNRNAVKHGYHAATAREERQAIRALMRLAGETLERG